MPSGGHNRKPTALKILAGTAQPCRLKNEPKPAPVAPKCPSWLNKEAKKKWKELAPKLEKLGLLTELDGEKFAALCLHWSLMVEAARGVKDRGVLIPSAREDGALVKNPSLQILRDNSTAFDRYAAQFGLDPQNRSRLDMPPVREGDDDDAFFAYTRAAKPKE